MPFSDSFELRWRSFDFFGELRGNERNLAYIVIGESGGVYEIASINNEYEIEFLIL